MRALILFIAFDLFMARLLAGRTDSIDSALALVPLLPCVFFDEGSSLLPARYKLFKNSDDTRSFSEEQVSGGLLSRYYHVLNVIGIRLRKNPDAKILLTGSGDGLDRYAKADLIALERALSIKNYLMSVWLIDSSRMQIEFRATPFYTSNISDSTQRRSEYRRVDILSTDWEISKPLTSSASKLKTTEKLLIIRLKEFCDDCWEGIYYDKIFENCVYPLLESGCTIRVAGYSACIGKYERYAETISRNKSYWLFSRLKNWRETVTLLDPEHYPHPGPFCDMSTPEGRLLNQMGTISITYDSQKESTVATPLLNFIFFDLGDSFIPPRYILYNFRSEAEGFKENNIGGGLLKKYTQILNIIGSRMQRSPKTTITIVGCNDANSFNTSRQELKRGLSLSRARNVYNYLLTIWNIEGSRMKIRQRNLPKNPSNPRDSLGIEENRRVEISSNDNELFRPITDSSTLHQKSKMFLITKFPVGLVESGSNNEDYIRDYVLRHISASSMVEVVGHRDQVGYYDDYRLDETRARSVARFLSKFIDEKVIRSIRAVGEQHPLCSMRTPEGRMYNRCVEIIVSDPE